MGSTWTKATFTVPLPVMVELPAMTGGMSALAHTVARRKARQAVGKPLRIGTPKRLKRRALAIVSFRLTGSTSSDSTSRLLRSCSQPPHGSPKGLFVSGKDSVCWPKVFQSPVEKTPSEIAELVFGISHVIWPLEIVDRPWNQPAVRKTRSSWKNAAAGAAQSPRATTAPSTDPAFTFRMTLLPAPLRIRDDSRFRPA